MRVKKTEPNYYSVEELERLYPELTTQVRDNIEPYFDKTKYPHLRIVVCKMKVKGGKRNIVEYLTQKSKYSSVAVKNIFVTAWNRKADVSQREELKAYGIDVRVPSSAKKADAIIQALKSSTVQKRIHLDELDFGSGSNGLLSKVYTEFKTDESSVWIMYSATPEEILCSSAWKDIVSLGHGVFVEIEPPAAYVGMREYINAGKVKHASSMFDFDSADLTPHGKQVIRDAMTKYTAYPKKNISILRITGRHNSKSRFDWVKQNTGLIQSYVDEVCAPVKVMLRVKDIGSKSENAVKWDDYNEWEEKSTSCFFIYLLEQSACRATELRCHHRLNFYHTYRYTQEPCINSIIQDQERCVYYKLDQLHAFAKKYPDYVNLEPFADVYGDLDVANYSAGHLTLFELVMQRKDLLPSMRSTVIHYSERIKPCVLKGKTLRELTHKINREADKLGLVLSVSKTFTDGLINSKGLCESTIRSVSKVYSTAEIIKTNAGISTVIGRGRMFIAYENANDPSTVTYIAMINTGDVAAAEVRTDSSGSMYSAQ